MSDQHTTILTDFYQDRITPLANAADDAGVEIFPMGLDPDRESYFTDREAGESYIHAIDSDDLTGELQKLWAADPIPGMAEIAAPLLAIADVLHEKEQTSDEVSPFIYAMF